MTQTLPKAKLSDVQGERVLTRGQRAFFDAVANGTPGIFHRRTIEPIEGLPFGQPGGLVTWIGGMRLVGCNSFSASNFALTEEGHALVKQALGSAS